MRCAFAAAFFCAVLGSANAQTPPDNPDEHGQGLIPDTAEQLSDVGRTPTYRAFIPERVDLSGRMPRPGDQGRQGSCVGWAVGYAARSYYASRDGRSLNNPANIPSPAYIYNRIKEGGSCDTGSSIYAALSLLKRHGALSLDDYPYSQSRCPPVSDALANTTTDFKLRDFEIVDPKRPDQIKAELAKENPVIFSLRTTRAFNRLGYGDVYRYPDVPTGYHAITAVGYDDRKQAFKLINSWGTRWGEGGFTWIDYDTVTREVNFAYVMRVDPKTAPEPLPIVDPLPPQPTPPPRPSPTPAPVIVVPPPPPAPAPVVVVPPLTPVIPHPVPAPVVDIDIPKCEHVVGTTTDNKVTITGFVGSDERLEQWKKDPAYANADIKLVVRPWPQCEALLTLDKNMARADKPQVHIRRTSGDVLAEGENLRLDIVTPPFPSYLHVAYVQADGSVLNLVQPGAANFKIYSPNSKLTIGDGAGGGPTFRVSRPFGREMLIVTAARAPLFSDARPAKETEREFLTALRLALVAKPDPSLPDRDVAANFDAIVTQEKKTP